MRYNFSPSLICTSEKASVKVESPQKFNYPSIPLKNIILKKYIPKNFPSDISNRKVVQNNLEKISFSDPIFPGDTYIACKIDSNSLPKGTNAVGFIKLCSLKGFLKEARRGQQPFYWFFFK